MWSRSWGRNDRREVVHFLTLSAEVEGAVRAAQPVRERGAACHAKPRVLVPGRSDGRIRRNEGRFFAGECRGGSVVIGFNFAGLARERFAAAPVEGGRPDRSRGPHQEGFCGVRAWTAACSPTR